MLALTIVITGAITYVVHPQIFTDNPIFHMMGYNSPCVAWDYNPAKTVGSVLFSYNIYFSIRYAVTRSQRSALTHFSDAAARCVVAANMMFALSVGCLSLIFVITPEDGTLSSLRSHTMLFIQYIFFRFVAVAVNWVEAPEVTAAQWAFIALSGITTCAELTMGIYTLAKYNNDGVHVVPPIVPWIVDWTWFVFLPLTSFFMPEGPLLLADYQTPDPDQSIPVGRGFETLET
mmetsp:Transcript_64136/g.177944  ORF Transcript_64136/g.177944 Transcript_64136/m.177944 type:complete len:232 (+) Transcript_64136:3-698(+)